MVFGLFLRVTAFWSDLRVGLGGLQVYALQVGNGRQQIWAQSSRRGRSKGRDTPGGYRACRTVVAGASWAIGVNITIDGRIRQPTKREKPIKMVFLANR